MPANSHSRTLFGMLGVVLLLAVPALLGVARSALAARPPEQGRAMQRDVTYCTAGGVPLLMDIYSPDGGNGARWPALLFVHGGSWAAGDKASGEGEPEISDLVSRG